MSILFVRHEKEITEGACHGLVALESGRRASDRGPRTRTRAPDLELRENRPRVFTDFTDWNLCYVLALSACRPWLRFSFRHSRTTLVRWKGGLEGRGFCATQAGLGGPVAPLGLKPDASLRDAASKRRSSKEAGHEV